MWQIANSSVPTGIYPMVRKATAIVTKTQPVKAEELPTTGWTLERLGEFASAQYGQATILLRQSAMAYFRAGMALNLARPHFPKKATTREEGFDAWCEKIGVAKTKAYEAMQFAAGVAAAKAEKQLESLDMPEARKLYGITKKPQTPTTGAVAQPTTTTPLSQTLNATEGPAAPTETQSEQLNKVMIGKVNDLLSAVQTLDSELFHIADPETNEVPIEGINRFALVSKLEAAQTQIAGLIRKIEAYDQPAVVTSQQPVQSGTVGGFYIQRPAQVI